MTNDASLPTWIYVAGYGRSGSTLLDRLLGATGAAISAGELGNLLPSLPRPPYTCSCGRTVEECPRWGEVLRRLAAAYGSESPGGPMRTVGARFESLGALSGLLSRASGPSAEAYCRANELIHSTLVDSDEGRHRIVVDSSKTGRRFALRPWALATVCRHRVHVVHIVRDGRAVLWSQLRARARRGEELGWLQRCRLGVKTTFSWQLAILMAELNRWLAHSGRFVRVRYEDLVDDPQGTLEGLLEALGLREGEVRVDVDRAAHLFAGNRMRLAKGGLAIKRDHEWVERLDGAARAIHWLLGWPGHCYHALLRSPARNRSS